MKNIAKFLGIISLLWLLNSCVFIEVIFCGTRPCSGVQSSPSPTGTKTCVGNGFSIANQGFNSSGNVGGLVVISPPYEGTPFSESIDSPSVAADELVKDSNDPVKDVGILVVDHFFSSSGEESIILPSDELLDIAQKDLPNATMVRQRKLKGILNKLVKKEKLSHGALVFNQISALIVADSYTLSDNSEDKATFENSQHKIVVKAFNIGTLGVLDEDDYLGRSAILPHPQAVQESKLQLALQEFVDMGIEQVVIHLSFERIFCPFENDSMSFEEFSEHFINSAKALRVQGIENIIHVAPAGNYNDPSRPLDSWQHSPDVISVSSKDFHSNINSFVGSGHIRATGAWFTLTNPVGISGEWEKIPEIIYGGTYFAAPIVTVFTAYDLASQSPKCGNRPDTKTPKLAGGHNQNLLLPDAIAQKCIE